MKFFCRGQFSLRCKPPGFVYSWRHDGYAHTARHPIGHEYKLSPPSWVRDCSPGVSPGDQPLTEEPVDSGYEIGIFPGSFHDRWSRGTKTLGTRVRCAAAVPRKGLHGELSCPTSNRRRLEISRRCGNFGFQNCCTCHFWSSVVLWLYLEFSDTFGWRFRGRFPQVRSVTGNYVAGKYSRLSSREQRARGAGENVFAGRLVNMWTRNRNWSYAQSVLLTSVL